MTLIFEIISDRHFGDCLTQLAYKCAQTWMWNHAIDARARAHTHTHTCILPYNHLSRDIYFATSINISDFSSMSELSRESHPSVKIDTKKSSFFIIFSLTQSLVYLNTESVISLFIFFKLFLWTLSMRQTDISIYY